MYANVPFFYLQAHNTYRRNVRPRAANMKELVGPTPAGPAPHVSLYRRIDLISMLDIAIHAAITLLV